MNLGGNEREKSTIEITEILLRQHQQHTRHAYRHAHQGPQVIDRLGGGQATSCRLVDYTQRISWCAPEGEGAGRGRRSRYRVAAPPGRRTTRPHHMGPAKGIDITERTAFTDLEEGGKHHGQHAGKGGKAHCGESLNYWRCCSSSARASTIAAPGTTKSPAAGMPTPGRWAASCAARTWAGSC